MNRLADCAKIWHVTRDPIVTRFAKVWDEATALSHVRLPFCCLRNRRTLSLKLHQKQVLRPPHTKHSAPIFGYRAKDSSDFYSRELGRFQLKNRSNDHWKRYGGTRQTVVAIETKQDPWRWLAVVRHIFVALRKHCIKWEPIPATLRTAASHYKIAYILYITRITLIERYGDGSRSLLQPVRHSTGHHVAQLETSGETIT